MGVPQSNPSFHEIRITSTHHQILMYTGLGIVMSK